MSLRAKTRSARYPFQYGITPNTKEEKFMLYTVEKIEFTKNRVPTLTNVK